MEQIKERLSVVEVVSSYLKLEKAGSNFKAKCPFHREKTPSFFVSPGRGTYYCFGCGAKGDVFTFVQQFEGTDFSGALKILGNRAGVAITREDPKVRDERQGLYRVMESAAVFFAAQLQMNPAVSEYVKSRGVGEKSIREWRLGFSLPEWRALYTHLRGQNFSEQEMELAGLIKKGDDGTSYYDRFRRRIMFPLFDNAGRVVAFSGRVLPETGDEPKYLNSPETPIFTKSRLLYGFHRARQGIRKFGFSLLVEGQLDLILCHEVGLSQAVATSGTALSRPQVDLMERIFPNLIILFDADAAGVKAAIRAAALSLSGGLEVKIARLPGGMDPAEMALKNKSGLLEAIRLARPVVEFYLARLKEDIKDERQLARRIVTDVLPLVAAVPSAVLQSHFIKVISTETGINEAALLADLSRVKPDTLMINEAVGASSVPTASPERTTKTDRISILERHSAGLILWLQTLANPPINPDELQRRWEQISDAATVGGVLAALTKEEKHEIIFEVEARYHDAADITREMERLFSDLAGEYLKRELQRIIRQIGEAERRGDHLRALSLLKRSKDVSGRIQAVRQSRS